MKKQLKYLISGVVLVLLGVLILVQGLNLGLSHTFMFLGLSLEIVFILKLLNRKKLIDS